MRFPVVAMVMLMQTPGCVGTMEDNSLEAAEVAFLSEELTEGSGALSAAVGEEEGDWALAVGALSVNYHSPSRVDLAPFSGEEVSLSISENFSVGPTVLLSDADGLVFLSTASDDGSSVFGRVIWKAGDFIGKAELPKDIEDETQAVRFVEVLVSDDSGEQVVLPGEPTRIEIDGVAYRFTVTTAYEAENPKNSKCGAPDILAIEMVRSDDVPNETLTRSANLRAPVGSCG